MPIHTTYSRARAQLAKLCDEVAEGRELVIISRRGKEPVAMIAADELAGLAETAHLLRSPKNAERLLTAVRRARGSRARPRSVVALRRELGLEP